MAKSKAKIELGKLIMAHRTLEAYAKERVCVKLAYKIFLFRKKAAEHEEFFSSKVNGIIIAPIKIKPGSESAFWKHHTQNSSKANVIPSTAKMRE